RIVGHRIGIRCPFSVVTYLVDVLDRNRTTAYRCINSTIDLNANARCTISEAAISSSPCTSQASSDVMNTFSSEISSQNSYTVHRRIIAFANRHGSYAIKGLIHREERTKHMCMLRHYKVGDEILIQTDTCKLNAKYVKRLSGAFYTNRTTSVTRTIVVGNLNTGSCFKSHINFPYRLRNSGVSDDNTKGVYTLSTKTPTSRSDIFVTAEVFIPFAFYSGHTTPCSHNRLGVVVCNAHEDVS